MPIPNTALHFDGYSHQSDADFLHISTLGDKLEAASRAKSLQLVETDVVAAMLMLGAVQGTTLGVLLRPQQSQVRSVSNDNSYPPGG